MLLPTVSGLFIYPIKSCGGMAIEEGVIEERGFRHDRRWMVTDERGMFLTQREEPRLALAHASIAGEDIEVTAKGLMPVRMPLHWADGESMSVEIWGQTVEAVRGPMEAEKWFKALLGRTCRVVYMPDTSDRPMAVRDSPEGHRIAFSDAVPFLLISEGSLDELNRRLDSPVPMNRFRPNIVVGGVEPHAEDRWKDVRIGGVKFEVLRPCSRCTTTTVDQDTGIRGVEPLRTLSTYRRRGTKVMFGQNVIHRGLGMVRIGNELEVLSVRDFE